MDSPVTKAYCTPQKMNPNHDEPQQFTAPHSGEHDHRHMSSRCTFRFGVGFILGARCLATLSLNLYPAFLSVVAFLLRSSSASSTAILTRMKQSRMLLGSWWRSFPGDTSCCTRSSRGRYVVARLSVQSVLLSTLALVVVAAFVAFLFRCCPHCCSRGCRRGCCCQSIVTVTAVLDLAVAVVVVAASTPSRQADFDVDRLRDVDNCVPESGLSVTNVAAE